MRMDQAMEFFKSNPTALMAAGVAVAAVVIVQIILAVAWSSKSAKAFLNPAEFQPLTLTDQKFITHNTLWLKFALPDPKQRLGLPIGQHITFNAKGPDGKDVLRSYTPVTDDDMLGSVEFVIKVYPQGKMSQALRNLEVGQSMLMRGPKGRLQYKPNMKKHIGMLAGGTGVTPMYQVLNAILKNPSDKTKVSLVCGNLTEDDILLRKELDALVVKHPQQLKVYHVLNTPSAGWSMGSGFITTDIIKAQLPAPGPDTLIVQCGPPPMVEAMKKHLEALGYDADMQFCF